MGLEKLVAEKNVLFVTTKNIDYIRNTQELNLLNEYAQSVEVICSSKKNYAARIIEVWFKLFLTSAKKFDVSFWGFSPQLVVPFFVRKFKDTLIIEDFFISVFDTLVNDRKKFSTKSLMGKFCHKLDEVTIARANHIISDTNAHADYFKAEFKPQKGTFETLYLEADNKIYYPRPQVKDEKLSDKYVVLYFGSILPLQGIEVILEALREFKDNSNYFFYIIGPVSEKYNKPIQDNICYIDWLSQDELAEHISQADLCLAGHFRADIDKASRTIAGKTYIYDNMQKNIILGDGVANHELFCEDDRHHFVPMGNSSALAESIKRERAKKYGND